MQVRNFEPDYTKLYTASEAEYELTNFKFLGPGWYIAKTETLLVVPNADVEKYTAPHQESLNKGPWKQVWDIDQLFWFFFYEGNNPLDSFDAITNAPIRLNDPST